MRWFYLMALLALSSMGCWFSKPACEVIALADYVCVNLLLADGSVIALSKDDAQNPEAFAKALGKRGIGAKCGP